MLDLRDPLDPRERREREDPPARSALVVLLETVALAVLLAAVVCLALREEPDLLACLVLVEPLVLLDPVDPLEMLVALASLV